MSFLAVPPMLELPLNGSALQLAHIPVRPPSICGATCCLPVLSFEEAPDESHSEIMDALRSTPCPSWRNIEQVYDNWVKGDQFQFFSVQTAHDGFTVTLPSWVITFWQSVASFSRDIYWWHEASEMLLRRGCQDAHALLGTIPWHARFPVPNVDVVDLARLVTEEPINDSLINLLTWFVNCRLEKFPVRLLHSAYPPKIFKSYQAARSGQSEQGNHAGWINEPREQLRKGEIHQIGLCLNVVAGSRMPDSADAGNHWVAVVLDGHSQSIWFGDSLGHPPDPALLEMIHWWLRPSFQKRFTVRPLRFNKQRGSWSSGDRVINMIAHHFHPDEFQLLSGTDEAAMCNRIELFLRIMIEIRAQACTSLTMAFD